MWKSQTPALPFRVTLLLCTVNRLSAVSGLTAPSFSRGMVCDQLLNGTPDLSLDKALHSHAITRSLLWNRVISAPIMTISQTQLSEIRVQYTVIGQAN